MKLIDRIENAEHYIDKFSTWEASEIIIDDKKAFWCLKKPDSEYQKVCLYRDGCNMFIYGDYGQFTFDKMTWLGSVYNLEYDNIGYQAEKLSFESRQSLYIHDETECKEDIFRWLEQTLNDNYYMDIDEEQIKEIMMLFRNSKWLTNYNIETFCIENDLYKELYNLLEFANDCLNHTEDKYEWIAFLRDSDLEYYDEVCESRLWDAGKIINQRYLICLYALQVCGEKLKRRSDDN